MTTKTGLFAILLGLFSVFCAAEEYEINLDDPQLEGAFLDRWMYPFNQTPGKRIQASTFGAIGSEGFDERDGQYIIAVDTAAVGVPANLPPSQYKVNSASLTLTETFGGYDYDPTYDSFKTYLDPESSLFEDDEDAGRPIELYGVGLRGDFTEYGWPDGDAFEPPVFGSGSAYGGRGKNIRSVYAADAQGTDVSNNVMALANGEGGFDPTPFAVARMLKDNEELEAGTKVTALSQWSFEISVEEPDIHSYLVNGLSTGQLGLAVTSLHSTGVQGQGDPFPNAATADHFAFAGPLLTLDVEILENLPGDFDGDGELTALDIDVLSAAVRTNGEVDRFDLEPDGVLDDQDRVVWVEELYGTVFGDFDLNREVAFPDFLQLAQNFGENGGWAQGDFDGDGIIAFADFLGVSQNFGQSNSSISAAVPEPNSAFLLATAISLLLTQLNKLGRAAGHRSSKGKK